MVEAPPPNKTNTREWLAVCVSTLAFVVVINDKVSASAGDRGHLEERVSTMEKRINRMEEHSERSDIRLGNLETAAARIEGSQTREELTIARMWKWIDSSNKGR